MLILEMWGQFWDRFKNQSCAVKHSIHSVRILFEGKKGMQAYSHCAFFIPRRIIVAYKFCAIFILANSKNNGSITYTSKIKSNSKIYK